MAPSALQSRAASALVSSKPARAAVSIGKKLRQTANVLASLVVLSLFGLSVYGAVSAGEILVRRRMFG